MRNDNDMKAARKGLHALVALAVVLGIAILALIVGLVVNAQGQLTSVAAQDDSELLDDSQSSEPKLTNATTQVINLVSLMGLSQSDAVTKIGHGAWVQDKGSLSTLGFSHEVVVVLSDEKGDSLSGTPTVTLGLDSSGQVAAASYEASTALLGYGELSFVDAVSKFHIVEHVVSAVGLNGIDEGSVALPDRKDYSFYGSDRVTLDEERYTFKGTELAAGQSYSWNATLDYDYTEANEASDLSKTVKKITVSIMKG